jgi:uncharacterized protein YukE
VADTISFLVIARDLASRTFREVGREALAMAAKIRAANAASSAWFTRSHSEFGIWLRAILVGMPLIPPLVVATANALAGLNSVLMSTMPGIGALGAAFVANFKAIKDSQPFDNLAEAWKRFGKATNPAIMDAVVAGVRILTDLMRRAVPIVNAFAGVLTDFLQRIKTEMQGPAFDKFLHWLRTVGAANFRSLLLSLENLMVGLGHLAMAFTKSGLDIGDWLVETSGKFRAWAANLRGSEGLGGFIDYFQSTWPRLKALVSELWGALMHLGQAVAPLSNQFMELATRAFAAFQRIPIPTLTRFIEVLVAAKVAAMVFSAAMALVNAAMATNPITLVVLALAALAAAFIVAYRNSATFRQAVQQGFEQVSAAARQFMAAAKPVIDWFNSPQGAASMKVTIGIVAEGVRTASTLMASQLRALAAVGQVVFPAIAQLCRTAASAFQAMGGVISAVSGAARATMTALRVAWEAVGAAFRTVGATISSAVNAVGGVIRALGATVSSIMSAMRGALQSTSGAWQAMLAVMRVVPSFGWISSLIGLLQNVASAAAAAASAVASVASAIINLPSLPTLRIPGFHAGGRPQVGQLSLVGERGPELFVPDTAGTIIPADKTDRMIRRDGGTPVLANDQSIDVTRILEELQSIRAVLQWLPRDLAQQQRRLA